MKYPQFQKIVTLQWVVFTILIGLTTVFQRAEAFDAQGHRGARGLMPENSLPGFARALEIGVHSLELDVAVTGDFEVVVTHDPRLEPKIAREPTGDWLAHSSPAISTLTLKQLQTYDVGRLNPESRYASYFPDQTAVDGTIVPSLNQVFELVRQSRNQSVRFNIETKINPLKPEQTHSPEQFVKSLISVIEQNRMLERVTIQSFDWRSLTLVQKLAPTISTAYLSVEQEWLKQLQIGMPGPSPWLGGIDIDDFGGSAARAVKSAGGDIWSPYHQEVDVDSIELAHQLGLSVVVWTVNRPERMHQLIEMGVDGIITDYPDRLRKVMQERNMPLPHKTRFPPGAGSAAFH